MYLCYVPVSRQVLYYLAMGQSQVCTTELSSIHVIRTIRSFLQLDLYAYLLRKVSLLAKIGRIMTYLAVSYSGSSVLFLLMAVPALSALVRFLFCS